MNLYRPRDLKFVSVGGQSKIFAFHSETLERDLIIKIYNGRYYREAEQEYNIMNQLSHENVLQVYQLGTIKSIVEIEQAANLAQQMRR